MRDWGYYRNAATTRHARISSIFNFQFSIFNFQFLFAWLAICACCAAAEPPRPAQRSTDDALRDSLDSHAGDDYDRALLGELGKKDTKDRAPDDLEKKLKQQLGPASQREADEKDPLLRAANGMKDAQKLLAQGKSDAITQQVQREVVADLEKIIDQAKKSGKSLGPMNLAGTPNPSGKTDGEANRQGDPGPRTASGRPARESDPNANRSPKQATTEQKSLAVKRMRQQYEIGLQAHSRDTMLELPSPYFLPDYEPEIEDYFRRLSAGKPLEER
jgi:hypothetical protein